MCILAQVCHILKDPAGRTLTSDLSVNSFIMVVYEKKKCVVVG